MDGISTFDSPELEIALFPLFSDISVPLSGGQYE